MIKKASGSRRARVTRRKFLVGGSAALSGVAAAAYGLPASAGRAEAATTSGSHAVHLDLTVNGVERHLEVPPYATLAEVLRDQVGLTGVKIGCNRGECGACTVLLDDTPVYACSQVAALADGARIITIEGLAKGDELDPIQQAFIECDALQCGFCTPGQIMSARGLLNVIPRPTEAEVRRALSGNLCRCGCYNHIVAAVLAAADADSKG